MSLNFREAKFSDHSRLVEFQIALAWETEKLKLDPETCRLGVEAILKNPQLGQYYIAERQNEPIGCLLIIREWSDWRNGVVWWIHGVYLMSQERKNGVFSKFYHFIQNLGKEQEKIRGLRLYVDKTNLPAQAVYRKLGMTNQHYDLYEWMRGN